MAPPSQRNLVPHAGRRRARKKARTRGEIFAAAMELFSERGFDSVTVEQICAAADVARGTFFLHFPAKAALLREWGRALAGELRARQRGDRASILSQVRALVEHLGEQCRGRPDAARALLRELLSGPGSEPAAEAEDDLHAAIADLVRRGQERGELRRNVSPEVAATVLLSACAAVFASAPYGEDAPAQLRDELLHALLHGLHEPKPRIPWRPA
jgi:AcrR family transcriptional regulator